MDFKKIAYDLAVQYSYGCLTDPVNELDSPEEKADAMLKAFKFAYDYFCEQLGVSDK